jgi:hypothetical protein
MSKVSKGGSLQVVCAMQRLNASLERKVDPHPSLWVGGGCEDVCFVGILDLSARDIRAPPQTVTISR